MGIKTPTIGLMTIPYYGNNGSLDPSIYEHLPSLKLTARTWNTEGWKIRVFSSQTGLWRHVSFLVNF